MGVQPSNRLAPFARPVDGSPVLPTPGVDGFVALQPLAEPLSVGKPPVTPDLVQSVRPVELVRSVRACSGHLMTTPLDGGGRALFSVGWTTLSSAEAATLLSWLDVDLQYTRFAFTLQPDGPDGAEVEVRFLSPPALVQKGAGVYTIAAVDAEEIL